MYVYIGLAERVGDPLVRPRAKIRRPSLFFVAGDRSFLWGRAGARACDLSDRWSARYSWLGLGSRAGERWDDAPDKLRSILALEKVDLSLRKAMPSRSKSYTLGLERILPVDAGDRTSIPPREVKVGANA